MAEQTSNGELGRLKEKVDQLCRRCDGIEERERDSAHELSRLATATADRFDQLKILTEDVRLIRDTVMRMDQQCGWCKNRWEENEKRLKEVEETSKKTSEKLSIFWKVGAAAWAFVVAVLTAKWFWINHWPPGPGK